jgi:translation initiation factor 2B subunit (eIF-2B alpha/beta/delta family)
MDILKQLRQAVSGNKVLEPVNRLNRIARTIESLRSLMKDSKVSQSVKDMIGGLMTLVTTRPNITGINHYFNHFLLRLDPDDQLPVLKELLEVYHERWKHVERKTAEVAFNMMFKGVEFKSHPTILLHGEDKAVEALFDILMVRQMEVKIFQTLGRPSEIGKKQAEKLLENGFKVNFIDESTVANILPEVDYVLLGCELILHDDFINISGTHTVLAAARYYNRPVYVLADSRRIMNTKFFPQNAQQAILGEGKSYNKQIWKNAPEGVTVTSNDRETVPNHLVSAFILEDSSHSPEEIHDEIDKVMVKKFF